jgi:hypothetical protein
MNVDKNAEQVTGFEPDSSTIEGSKLNILPRPQFNILIDGIQCNSGLLTRDMLVRHLMKPEPKIEFKVLQLERLVKSMLKHLDEKSITQVCLELGHEVSHDGHR